ncbi:MAG: hypothetical protein MHM6MM_006324 [Cercozoa sp. M6MM]
MLVATAKRAAGARRAVQRLFSTFHSDESLVVNKNDIVLDPNRHLLDFQLSGRLTIPERILYLKRFMFNDSRDIEERLNAAGEYEQLVNDILALSGDHDAEMDALLAQTPMETEALVAEIDGISGNATDEELEDIKQKVSVYQAHIVSKGLEKVLAKLSDRAVVIDEFQRPALFVDNAVDRLRERVLDVNGQRELPVVSTPIMGMQHVLYESDPRDLFLCAKELVYMQWVEWMIMINNEKACFHGLNGYDARTDFCEAESIGEYWYDTISPTNMQEFAESGSYLNALFGPFGTIENPVKVPARGLYRVVGCCGGRNGEREHPMSYMLVRPGPKHRCPDCGQIFVLDSLSTARMATQGLSRDRIIQDLMEADGNAQDANIYSWNEWNAMHA